MKLLALLVGFLAFVFACYLVFLSYHDKALVKPAKKSV